MGEFVAIAAADELKPAEMKRVVCLLYTSDAADE